MPPPSSISNRPRKRFAQHFLVQPAIAQRIVDTAALEPGEAVLEIGPGRGVLTRRLAARAARLWAVEIDRDLAAALRAEFAADPRVEIVAADVLRLDLPTLLAAAAPVAVVANLPYNISTPVLLQLLDTPDLFSRLVLMLQREVAERVCAPPGGKVYGALTVTVQLVARPAIAFRVPPGAFHPRPQVESAVVVLTPHRPPRLTPPALAAVRCVVRTAFAQRRKQLGNALAPLCPDAAARLTALGIDPTRRPETLAIEEFITVAGTLLTTRLSH
jgi:16S rRNA (adenine1518-N6/adenine1519-N6)-dimethyltransferase